MSLFTSSFNPLLADLVRQKERLKAYAIKIVAFLALLFLCDRGSDILLRRGLDHYFGLNRPGEILCVGNSRTVLGINTIMLEQSLRVPVVKYALEGANIGDRLAMIKHYFNRQPDSVKLVIYDVDSFTFTGEGLSSNSCQMFFPYLDDPTMRSYLSRFVPSRFEMGLRYLFRTIRYDEVTVALACRGLMDNTTNFKRGTVDLNRVRNQIVRGKYPAVKLNPQSIKDFDETIRFIRAHGAQVILAYIPEVDVLNDVDRAGQRRVMEIFKQYAAKDNGIFLFDYNCDYEHHHEIFYDALHLNPLGLKIVTERLGADIKSLPNWRTSATPERRLFLPPPVKPAPGFRQLTSLPLFRFTPYFASAYSNIAVIPSTTLPSAVAYATNESYFLDAPDYDK